MARGRPRSFDRDKALESALTLFWERGYEGVTLEQLLEAMGGITPPSLYAAFGSKEDLFLEALERYRDTVGMRPRRALEAGATARDSVEALLLEAVNVYTAAKNPRGCLVMAGFTCNNPAVQGRVHEMRQQVPDIFRRRLERGVREGDLPEGLDLSAIASFYATVVHGLAQRARDGTSRRALVAAVEGAMAAWSSLTRRARP
jgi:AcrR family transcriptional regulator